MQPGGSLSKGFQSSPAVKTNLELKIVSSPPPPPPPPSAFTFLSFVVLHEHRFVWRRCVNQMLDELIHERWLVLRKDSQMIAGFVHEHGLVLNVDFDQDSRTSETKKKTTNVTKRPPPIYPAGDVRRFLILEIGARQHATRIDVLLVKIRKIYAEKVSQSKSLSHAPAYSCTDR